MGAGRDKGTSALGRAGPGGWSRLAVALVFGWSTTVGPVLAQTPPAADGVPPGVPSPSAGVLSLIHISEPTRPY